MIIRNARIILVNEDRPIKTGMILERDDLVVSCEIDGGIIEKNNREENIDILFKSCAIENCEYENKAFPKSVPPCPIVDSCIIKNCKLPHTYYVGCYFKEREKK